MTARRPDRVRARHRGQGARSGRDVRPSRARAGGSRSRTGSQVLVAGVGRRVRRRAGTDEPTAGGVRGHRRPGRAPRSCAVSRSSSPATTSRRPRRAPSSGSTWSAARCSRATRGSVPCAAVEDGVAHDVLLLDSGLRLPFVEAVVPVVDIAARRIEIDPGARPRMTLEIDVLTLFPSWFSWLVGGAARRERARPARSSCGCTTSATTRR